MADDATVSDLHRKIERERALINAANQMRGATNNANVNSRLDSSIRDAQRNIRYFEQTLQDLQTRRVGNDMQGMSLGDGGPRPPAHSRESAGPRQTQDRYDDPSGYGAPDGQGYSTGGGHDLMPPRPIYDREQPGVSASRPRPNYSRLGKHTICTYIHAWQVTDTPGQISSKPKHHTWDHVSSSCCPSSSLNSASRNNTKMASRRWFGCISSRETEGAEQKPRADGSKVIRKWCC